jgi:hypothetical protein
LGAAGSAWGWGGWQVGRSGWGLWVQLAVLGGKCYCDMGLPVCLTARLCGSSHRVRDACLFGTALASASTCVAAC